LLLHGFANSSHYFRHLMPKLAGRFHLIAPDLPSFGFTTIEEGAGYQFTFDGLTKTIQGFVNELSLRRFAMYVFDYGAPVGFNLAVADPDRVSFHREPMRSSVTCPMRMSDSWTPATSLLKPTSTISRPKS